MVCCGTLLWRPQKKYQFFQSAFHNVNIIWAFPNGQLNHEQEEKPNLDCISEPDFTFSLGNLLKDYSWKRQEKENLEQEAYPTMRIKYILYLPSPSLSLFCAEVLWSCSPWLHQGDQKSNQTHRRRNRSASSSKAWMGVESVLCFRRTHGTRSSVCRKGKVMVFWLWFVFFHPLKCGFDKRQTIYPLDGTSSFKGGHLLDYYMYLQWTYHLPVYTVFIFKKINKST